MNIPSSFNLLGHEVKVEYNPKLYITEEAYGRAFYNENKIEIQSPSDEVILNETVIEQTFLHEVTHLILNSMGEDDLNRKEKFVDMFASLLHQILTTAEYEGCDEV